MSVRAVAGGAALAAALIVAALAPRLGNDYTTSLAINLVLYGVLATAWGLFCGPTGYISLATVAFFGVGSYTVAVLGEQWAWPAVLAAAVGIGAVLALLVGLVTLRLSGTYFVIFTFGLTELLRQLVNWYESKISGSVGRYVFVEGATPPRQNRCRPHRTLNLGAMMEEQVGQIRTSIQGPCCGAVAAA